MYILTNSWQPLNYFTYKLIKKDWEKTRIAGGGGGSCTFSHFIIIFLYDQAKYI